MNVTLSPDGGLAAGTLQRGFRAWTGAAAVERAMKAAPGTELFLAGGAVRDLIGGRGAGPKDFDLFFGGADSDDFLAHLARDGSITYGPFGSPRWHPDDGGPYADVIPIDRFNNGVEPCGDITDALRQFDFTANAVAFNLGSGALHDPCGGLADFRNGILRAVRLDYPDEPIAAGHRLTRMAVLWIRLVHYAAVLGLRPDEQTREWLFANSRHARQRDLFAETFFQPAEGADTLGNF